MKLAIMKKLLQYVNEVTGIHRDFTVIGRLQHELLDSCEDAPPQQNEADGCIPLTPVGWGGYPMLKGQEWHYKFIETPEFISGRLPGRGHWYLFRPIDCPPTTRPNYFARFDTEDLAKIACDAFNNSYARHQEYERRIHIRHFDFQQAQSERDKLLAHCASLRTLVKDVTTERDEAIADRATLQKERTVLLNTEDTFRVENNQLKAQRDLADHNRDQLQRDYDYLAKAVRALRANVIAGVNHDTLIHTLNNIVIKP